MSRFTSDNKVKIQLNETEWVEIKESLSYNEILPIASQLDEENTTNNAKIAVPLIKKSVVGWNFKDGEGKDVPCNEENFEKLDMQTVLEIFPKLVEQYLLEKKSLEPSKE